MSKLDQLLSTPSRSYLVNREGQEVPIKELNGKVVGLYFSAHWCGPCREFTPELSFVYGELKSKGAPFEIVFISADSEADEFKEYLGEMPWLALPYEEEELRTELSDKFEVKGIPALVLLDEKGELISEEGRQLVSTYGAQGFPFTEEKLEELRSSIKLTTEERDFVIDKEGNHVKVSELEGKIVGLYFSAHWCSPCKQFTPLLAKAYEEWKAEGKDIEIIFISSDRDEEQFKGYLSTMPWLALPYSDRLVKQQLGQKYGIEGIPTLILLQGPEGEVITDEGVGIMQSHGSTAYPFTEKRIHELMSSVSLVTPERDFLVDNKGKEVKVSELQGKMVGLLFSAGWFPTCDTFAPHLIKAFEELQAQGVPFEVVLISADNEEDRFRSHFDTMPWLAIPFAEHQLRRQLGAKYKVEELPQLVVLDEGLEGEVVTREGASLAWVYGSKAYPFTEERVREVMKEQDEEAKALKEEVKDAEHEHQLKLVHGGKQVGSLQNSLWMYGCDRCGELGAGWRYRCFDCDYDLHPKCLQSCQAVA